VAALECSQHSDCFHEYIFIGLTFQYLLLLLTDSIDGANFESVFVKVRHDDQSREFPPASRHISGKAFPPTS
jgi:hypothetical protein